MDLFNAATALVHNLTLVTHNTSDNSRIPGLTLTDWLAP
jgi:tRNA(fMet)-specific endonuclease VapC